MLAPLEVVDVFTVSECQRIIEVARTTPAREAALVGGTREDNTRRAKIYWLEDAADAAWIFRRLLETVADANRRHFGFDIEEFSEQMQVAQYSADPGGYFDWHVDCGEGPIAARRKMTMVVQLSNAAGYDGGALETNADGVTRAASRAIGSALLLPSFVLHRVSPVSRGERYSLTIWAHGPAFR